MTKRRVIIALFASMLLLSAFFLVPEIQRTREAASRSQEGHSYLHTGSHRFILVHVNRLLAITAVGICPTCYREGCPTIYLKEPSDEQVSEQSFTPSMELMAEAKSHIARQLLDPKFIDRRSRF